MPDIPKKPKFEVIQGGGGDARRLRADLVLADPGVTLDMITQDVFDALLESEIKDEQRNGAVSNELIYVLGQRIINRIVARLDVSTKKHNFNFWAARNHFQQLLENYLQNHTV